MLANSTLSGANGCVVVYVRSANLLYLYNDAANGLVPGSVTPGGGGSIANSQCTVSSGGLAAASGSTLTVPAALTFAAGFTGQKNVYGYALSNGSQSAGWQALGTWTGH